MCDLIDCLVLNLQIFLSIYNLKNPHSNAREVAKSTGRSLARIYATSQKENLPLGKANMNSNEAGQRNRERIKKLHQSKPNLTTKEIAHKTGLSITTVNQHLNMLGVKRTSKLRKRRMSKKYEKLKIS